MKKTNSIPAFHQLSLVLDHLGANNEWPGFSIGITEEEYDTIRALINKQFHLNGWFTVENVRQSLTAWGKLLKDKNLEKWTAPYEFTAAPKRVGLIMAGNIPLVGFHDLLSVVVSGHHAVVKLSSSDQTLLPALLNALFQFEPELKQQITISAGRLGEIDAVIATGSNNSLHYFESYFGKYPHIFRRNRTSLAVLDGTETGEELNALGSDIFSYFGLGCRNVSQLFVPQDFVLDRFFEGIFPYGDIVNHHKYANNYDYNKAVFLMNREEILDNGFLLLRESADLHSPLGMIYYKRYSDKKEVEGFIAQQKENLQAIVGHGYLPFGKAQSPELWDYADGVDTLKWLSDLK
ncbi:MAG: acyl-CoA reductase [Crocinitomicaceae bacterium]|nr:acyl-CoA reductase [Crocinitomicaceae bacterium]